MSGGFAKVFSSLWEGTLYGQGTAQLVFVYLLSKCDAHGIVDVTPQVIAGATGFSLDAVRGGLAVLEATDPESRTPDEEGRRIVRLHEHRSWGWRVVNHHRYREARDPEARREQTRVATAKWRAGRQVGEPSVSQGEPEVSRGEPKQKQKQKQKQETLSLPSVGRSLPDGPDGEGPEAGAPAGAPSLTPYTLGGPGSTSDSSGEQGGATRPAGDVWLPVVGKWSRVYEPESGVVALWREAYPALDLPDEFRRMRVWLEANRSRRRLTMTGAAAFVVGWLGKSDRDAARTRAGANRGGHRRASDATWLANNGGRIGGQGND